MLKPAKRRGLGETLGEGQVRTANDTAPHPEGSSRTLSIMGDPTLRLQVTAPPTNLSHATNGSNVTLTWTHSTAPNPTYFVYRSTGGIDGAFSRLTPSPVSTNTFTDLGAPGGAKLYQVRTLNLVTSGSGSYTNLSQGVFINVQ